MPFTYASVVGVFGRYNDSIWPMQLVAYLLVFAALSVAARKTKYTDRIIAAILAFFWLWIGIRFWLPSGAGFPPFYAVGALFILQGILFLIGVAKPSVSYRFGANIFSHTGIALMLYAMVGFPVGALLMGRVYPQMGIVGIFPCPTVLLTCGFLLCSDRRIPKYMLAIPLFWGIVGVYWTTLGLFEGAGLTVGALSAVAMIVYRDRKAALARAYRTA
jgi:hypothetical protein